MPLTLDLVSSASDLWLFSFPHRSIPHPRGHAHLAALVSHDSKFSNKTYINNQANVDVLTDVLQCLHSICATLTKNCFPFWSAYNFSHRIDHLSFGEAIPGIISPLDGTEKISVDCTSVLSHSFSLMWFLFFFWSRTSNCDCRKKQTTNRYTFSYDPQLTTCFSTSSPSCPPSWTPTKSLQKHISTLSLSR